MVLYRENASDYFEKNQFNQAIVFFEAEAILCLNQGDTNQFLTCKLWSYRFQILLGNYKKAIKAIKKLQARYINFFTVNLPIGYFSHFLLASAYYYIGDYEETRTHSDSAAELYPQSNQEDAQGWCEVLMIRGKGVWRRGDYVAAFNYFFEALVTGLTIDEMPPYVIGKTLNLIGMVAMDMKKENFHLAMPFLELSEMFYRDFPIVLPKDHLYYGILYSDKAFCYLRAPNQMSEERLQKAHKFNNLAKNIFSRLYGDVAHRYKATVLKNDARYQRESNGADNYQAIISALSREIQMRIQAYDGLKKHSTIARAHNHKSRAYFHIGKYKLARKEAHRAIIAAIESFNKKKPRHNPSLEQLDRSDPTPELLKAFHNKSEAYLHLFYRSNKPRYLWGALNALDIAVRLMFKIRKKFFSEESKLIMLDQTRRIHELALEILHIIYNQEKYQIKSKYLVANLLKVLPKHKVVTMPRHEEVYEIVQLSKSSILFEDIIKREERDREIEKNLLERSNQQFFSMSDLLPALIHQIENWGVGSKDDSSILDFENFVQHVKLFLGDEKKRTDKLVNNSMDDVELKEMYSSLDELKKGLDGNESAVISYFMGKKSLYGILVSKNHFQVEKLVEGPEKLIDLKRKSKKFWTLIDRTILKDINNEPFSIRRTEPSSSSNSKGKFVELACYFFHLLIKPFDLKQITRIYVIPDDELWSIPFEALIMQEKETALSLPYHKQQYLIHQFVISYHFSAPLIHHLHHPLQRKEPLYPATFMALLGDMLSQEERQEALDHLFACQEIFENKGFSLSEILTDPEYITIDRVLDILGTIDIILFHAHGVIEKEFGMIPAIKLKENLFLKQTDLLTGVKVVSQLLILQSCFTGRGPIRNGEGTMTLSRFFMLAGARNIIYAINSISQFSSSFIIQRMLKLISQEKMPIAKALNHVKKEFSQEPGITPAEWAGLVFIGDQTKTI